MTMRQLLEHTLAGRQRELFKIGGRDRYITAEIEDLRKRIAKLPEEDTPCDTERP